MKNLDVINEVEEGELLDDELMEDPKDSILNQNLDISLHANHVSDLFMSAVAYQNDNKLEIIQPKSYQNNIVQHITKQWHEINNKFGQIVFLETGAGKTYIAIMMIKEIFGEKKEIKRLTEEEIKEKKAKKKYDIENNIKVVSKKVIFLVPTNNLVEQQGNTIDQLTQRTVGKYHGGQKHKKFYKELLVWKREFNENDVFIFNGKKFYDLLMHGFIKIEDLHLIIFDECHHTDSDHLYNLVMKDFFFHKFDPEVSIRPRILGLTASPIKQKIEAQFQLKTELEFMLQNLCNNLYSQFIPISKEDLMELQNNIKVDIKGYQDKFTYNVKIVQYIENLVVKKIMELIPLNQCYKVENGLKFNQNDFWNFLQTSNEEEFKLDQDLQVLQFLNGKKQLIKIDQEMTKSTINLSKFQTDEQRLLVLLLIVILKNVNNLLIELGLAGVIEFFKDLQKVFIQKNNKFKHYKTQIHEILENFITVTQKNIKQHHDDFEEMSQKVLKLIEILQQSGSYRTIIFVKDRSVAFYLKNLLCQVFQVDISSSNMSSSDQHNHINPKIGFAMGQKGKSLLNKAYRSTNTTAYEMELESQLEKDLSFLQNSFGSVQMSNAQLMKTLSEFKLGVINILIATSVVEEGLDVANCNQIICLNELFTVKAFIQMRGRARQQNSKFFFICSEQQEPQAKQDYESFKEVIESMKSIAYNRLEEMKPDDDIVKQKQMKEEDVFEIPETGAKVVLREAKILLDLFINQAAEEYHRTQMIRNEDTTMNENLVDDVDLRKNHLFKPFYETKEVQRNGQKYFATKLYMPKSCRQYITTILPENVYLRKKDSENHVALLAIKKLFEQKAINEHLYPSISYKNELSSQSSNVSQMQQAQIDKMLISVTEEEEKAFRKEQEEFHLKQKKDKSKDVIQIKNDIRSLISQPLKCQDDDLYVYVFKGINQQNYYPYESTTDFIGFVFDRQLEMENMEFQFQQEYRQKQKNYDFMKTVFQSFGFPEKSQLYENANFSQESLKLVYKVEKESFKKLNLNENSQLTKHELRFFHTWIFYMMYSADQQFYKDIIKRKFPFTDVIFGNELRYLFRKYSYPLQQIYGDKILKGMNKIFGQQELDQCFAYLVPIKLVRLENGQENLIVNKQLIKNCINFVKVELLRLVTSQDTFKTKSTLTINDSVKEKQDRIINKIWSSQTNKIRHIVMDSYKVSHCWDQKSIVVTKNLYNGRNVDNNMSNRQRFENQSIKCISVPDHYFYKGNILLSEKENYFITKCRKERHFLDFNIHREQNESHKYPYQSSTLFDVPSEILTLFPLSYDQYQVFQQSCSFLYKANEYLLVEAFINNYFNGLKCYNPQQLAVNNKSINAYHVQEEPLLQQDDIFTSTETAPLQMTTQLLKNYKQVLESLTAPTAHRENDYERLEFLGDSVITCLVIVELFLTKEAFFKEGDLDFHRIKTISNMNFMKVNKKKGMFNYMITEPQNIFTDFIPGAIDARNYQTKIKLKHINELYNKLTFLKQKKIFLEKDSQQVEFDMKELVIMVDKIVDEERLKYKFFTDFQIDHSQFDYNNKRDCQEYLLHQILYMISQGENINPKYLQLRILEDSISSLQIQILKNKNEKKSKNISQKGPTKKIFFYKQLADIVESVGGVVSLTSGLTATQDYLRTLEILKYDQNFYRDKLNNLESKQKKIEDSIKNSFYIDRNLKQLEDTIKYDFKCKTWLVEALTHKSFNESILESNQVHPQDYERLEFLGDSILNYLVAKYFYEHTIHDEQRKMPKELHKMKASIVNNVLLSLVIIENNMHQFIIFNDKAQQFQRQFEHYVDVVQTQLQNNGPTKAYIHQNNKNQDQNMDFSYDDHQLLPKQQFQQVQGQPQPIDFDLLYEYSLKIFGDIFESLIGAVFLDSRNINVTTRVLFDLLDPYIKMYANLENIQDHSRTKLLELWNSKPFTKNYKCYHRNEQLNSGQMTEITGYVQNVQVFNIKFEKDAKNKVRTFYKIYYKVIEEFINQYEIQFQGTPNYTSEQNVLTELKKYINSEKYLEVSEVQNKVMAEDSQNLMSSKTLINQSQFNSMQL